MRRLLLCLPSGPGVRRAMSLICLGLGVDYLFLELSSVASYQLQSAIMPLPFYGIVLLFLSAALHLSRRGRHGVIGRIVSGVAGLLFGVFAISFVAAAVWTGVTTYTIVALCGFGEMLSDRDQRGC